MCMAGWEEVVLPVWVVQICNNNLTVPFMDTFVCFHTRGSIIRLEELRQTFVFVWLFVSSIKIGTRSIIRVDEQSSIVCRSRQTMEDSWSRCIMRLVPVSILEMHNQMYNLTDTLSIWTDYASSSIKTAKWTS